MKIGQTKEYDIKIEKIYLNNNIDNKSMVIKVTDKELLEKTGGIVQGMSGSPIIQNGKVVRRFDTCYGKWCKYGICSFCRDNDKTGNRIKTHLY